jgi:hypothetical protein
MRAFTRTIAVAGFIAALIGVPAFPQTLRLSGGRLQPRPAPGGLEPAFRSLLGADNGPAWAGYAVPMVTGEHSMCCHGDCCGVCSLEEKKGTGAPAAAPAKVRLEGPRSLHVMIRFEQGRIDRIRMFSEECELDAGGLAVYWFADVRPPDSVAFLASFASGRSDNAGDGRKLADAAVAAIAFHRDPSADRAMEGFVGPGSPDALRERASFWLGNARGRRGYEVLRGMLRSDPSPRVREKVIFALTQSKEPEAVPAIIEAARTDASGHVRGQALFWLAQKAGRQAIEAIGQSIDNDPEIEVKKKAVFALSQLPASEGVPKLIDVASHHRNPEVRKQAMFWLGQSGDPGALAFFEQVLLKK